MEATSGKKWGTGLALNSSAMKRGECPSENMQGKELMKVCDTLGKEMSQERYQFNSIQLLFTVSVEAKETGTFLSRSSINM